MRIAASAGTLLVVLAGCVEPTPDTSGDVPEEDDQGSGGWSFLGSGSLHEDQVKFHSEGAFEAALAAGAKVTRAGEPPDGEDRIPPSIPMQTDDLDATWGEGRYKLSMIHWWGPPGPPPSPGPGTIATSEPGWQGFLLDPFGGHLQVMSGTVSANLTRQWGDHFLENVTTLSPDERREVIERLVPAESYCNPCHTNDYSPIVPPGWFDSVDGGRAWTRVDAAAAVSTDTLWASGGRVEAGSWWFQLDCDTATLVDRWGEGRATVDVGSNDIVLFTWHSGRPHSDEASYERLIDALEDTAIDVPAADELTWAHEEAETD